MKNMWAPQNLTNLESFSERHIGTSPKITFILKIYPRCPFSNFEYRMKYENFKINLSLKSDENRSERIKFLIIYL